MQSDRIAAEREFHNERYADDSERQVTLGKYYSSIDYGFQMHGRRVVQEVTGRRALEYGCGNGVNALQLASKAREIIAIDISDVAIEQACAAAASHGVRNVKFLVDNAEKLCLPDSCVHVVFGAGIIHHLDVQKATAEVRRVLDRTGVALFSEPLGHNPLLNWYRRRTPHLRSREEHPLTIRELRYMAQSFSRSKVTYFGLIAPLLGLLPSRMRDSGVVSAVICWLDKQLCRLPMIKRWAWYCNIELRV